MPLSFTEDDFSEAPSAHTFSESDFDEPKPKRPIPQLTTLEKLSDPLYTATDYAERIGYGLAHPIKMLETTAETAASQIAGKPQQLLVRPSELLEKPIGPDIPQIPQQKGLAKQVAAGLGNTVIDFANYMHTPEGILSLGIAGLPKLAQRAVLRAFATRMAVEAPKQLEQAVEAAKAGNYQEAAKHVGAAGGQVFMGKQMGKHAVEPPSRIGVTPTEPQDAPLNLQSRIGFDPVPAGPIMMTERPTLPQGGPIKPPPDVVALAEELAQHRQFPTPQPVLPSGLEMVRPKAPVEPRGGLPANQAMVELLQQLADEQAIRQMPRPAPEQTRPIPLGLPPGPIQSAPLSGLNPVPRMTPTPALIERPDIVEPQLRMKGGEEGASSQQEAATVYGDLQSRQSEGQGQVPPAEGSGGVQPQGPVQPQETESGQVPLKGPNEKAQGQEEALRETVAPTVEQLQAAKPGITPGAVELAQQHFGDVSELQRQSAAAQQEAAAASRKARIERLGSGVAGDGPKSQAEQAAVAKAADYREALDAVEKLKTPVAPSGEGLGIVPKGVGELQEIIKEAIGAPKDSPPPIKTDVKTPLPDFQEAGAAKKIFSQPFAFERLPIIGALFGGTRRLHGYINDALSRYWGEIGVGKAVSSALGNEYSWLDKAFNVKDGQITNIKPTREGQSLYISDVLEGLQRDPKAYQLDADQQRALMAINDLNSDFSKLESKYDLANVADNEGSDIGQSKGAYFPRIVTSRPSGARAGRGGGAVGSKAFFEKARMFDTEAEGWARGFKYENSLASRLATRAERLYKRMADKRLAEDKDLGGLSRKEKLAQLKETFAADLESGEITEAKLGQMVDSAEANGRIFQPAFFNKIFPPDVADTINKAFPNSNSSLRQSAVSVNNALKSLRLGFDLAVGFIQGQALAARHPVIWGKAWYNSIKALASKEFLPDYVRQNIEPVRELAQMGSSVGQLQEYMAGAGKGQIVERIPVVGPAAKAFGRQFSTFLDVAKVEMWKAYRETVPKEEWMNVVQSLESVLQTARMESVGVGGKRALTERVLFLAPSYYRGGLNLIAAMVEKGTSGKIARQAMGAYAVGGAVLFYGIGKMLGMDDNELLKRFNPARTDFMMWRFVKDGRATEIGLGGFYRSLMRLAGDTVKTSIENPGNWKSLSSEKNPIVRWYRGHSGPVVSTAWDSFTGKDYMGNDTDIPTAARRAITPLGVESITGKEGEPSPTVAEKVGAVVGLSSFPETSAPAVKEMNRKVRSWMAGSDDPKVRDAFERREKEHASTYGTLRKAIYTGDQKLFDKESKKLLETRTEAQMVKTMRQRANYPFTGSKEMEKDFVAQLSDEDQKLYDQAKDAQVTEYEKFLDLLESSGN